MRNVFAVALASALALLPAKASAQEYIPPVTQDALVAASRAHRTTYRWLRCLAKREATYNPSVTSWNGLYHGLFQYTWGRWNHEAPKYGFAGYSPYHAWAAAHVTAGVASNEPLWVIHGIWPPSRSCGSPFA